MTSHSENTNDLTGTTERPQTDIASISPSIDDNDEEPLLGGLGRPVFQLRIALVSLLRPIVIGLALADFVFIVKKHDGANIAAGVFTLLLVLWSILQIVFHILPCVRQGNKTPIEINFGPVTCIVGRKGAGHSPKTGQRSYGTIAVDLAFGLLTIIPVVASKRYPYYMQSIAHRVMGLSITILMLQVSIAIMNWFSIFRRAKICVYNDENEKAMMAHIRLPHD